MADLGMETVELPRVGQWYNPGWGHERNKQSKPTNPGTTWMWTNGTISWKNVYFETETVEILLQEEEKWGGK